MIKGKNQINEVELNVILTLLKEGYSIPEVSDKINRNKSTLYRLLKNNGIRYNEMKYKYIGGKSGKSVYRENGKIAIRFVPRTIYLQREKRRSEASRRYCRIEPGGKLEGYILEKMISVQWSPKQISGRWMRDTGERLSKDTIYRYVYSNHFHLVKKCFRRKGKRYINRSSKWIGIANRRMIERRPKIIDRRLHIGHWEGDTVVGTRGGSKQVILTNVERKSGYLLAKKLERGTGEFVFKATNELFMSLPRNKRKTMTYDNGGEFSEHEAIEKALNIRIYFAHPYHSWERGTNENTNGLLRQYLPKKTDFKDIREEELQSYVDRLNNRPRERLGFLTPHEVFIEGKSCIGL